MRAYRWIKGRVKIRISSAFVNLLLEAMNYILRLAKKSYILTFAVINH